MRTYGRAAYLRAREVWAEGEFGSEWEPYRLAAGEQGYIFPPTGSRHDDREVGQPSQRAIIHRAIEDTPAWLLTVVGQSKSWSQVVAAIIANEGGLREDADYAEVDAEATKERRDPHALQPLRDLLEGMR